MNRGRVSMTALPPLEPAPWFGKERLCTGCRARLLNRVEKGDGAWLRVLHEEACKSAPDRAIELRTGKRGGESPDRAAATRPRKTRVDDRPSLPGATVR